MTLAVPLAVITELAFRRLGRQLLEGLIAAFAALVLNIARPVGDRDASAPTELVIGMAIRSNGEWVVTLPGYVALLVGLLTVVGPRGRRRTVKWSWNLLWVAVGVLLITAGVSLPGLVVSFLIGRVTGLGGAVPVGRAVRAGLRGQPRRGRPAGRVRARAAAAGGRRDHRDPRPTAAPSWTATRPRAR